MRLRRKVSPASAGIFDTEEGISNRYAAKEFLGFPGNFGAVLDKGEKEAENAG
jgi:hypothetical protein